MFRRGSSASNRVVEGTAGDVCALSETAQNSGSVNNSFNSMGKIMTGT